MSKLPVYFLGQDTGILEDSKIGAAQRVHTWLWERRGEYMVPEEYRPKEPRLKNHPRYCERAKVPTMGRLMKNTRQLEDRYEVGLGIPDRRHR